MADSDVIATGTLSGTGVTGAGTLIIADHGQSRHRLKTTCDPIRCLVTC